MIRVVDVAEGVAASGGAKTPGRTIRWLREMIMPENARVYVEHKKVELVELFFDLVLVYAISKTTGLIHQLHQGVLDPAAVTSFITAYVIIVNAWMYQVVFTNRYGSNSPLDIIFSFVTMALLLFLSNTISVDWETTFIPFSVTLGLVFTVQMIQYMVAYVNERNADGRFLIRGFLLLTGVYATALFSGSLLSYGIGIYVTMAGLVVNLLLPLPFVRRLNRIPLNFPHLVERLTLLVIITFGEMVVGIASWFIPEKFSAVSVFVFTVCVVLFVHYMWVFDRMIDLGVNGQGAARLEYAHLPVFLGLGMTTVSLSFLGEKEANLLFATAFLYTGLLLFYAGVFASRAYLQERFRPTTTFELAQLAVLATGFAMSMMLSNSVPAVAGIAAGVVCCECGATISLWRRGANSGVA